jgi:hypothetical protein
MGKWLGMRCSHCECLLLMGCICLGDFGNGGGRFQISGGCGIGSALVEGVGNRARKAGVLLLHVAGDPQFYMRFGFVPAYLQGRAVVDVVLDEEASVLREATANDVAHLAALSVLETAGDVGFVRVCWNHETLAIYEAGIVDDPAANCLLRDVCQWAVRRVIHEVVCHLPPHNRLMQAAAKQGATLEVWQDNELQVKVLDVVGVMARCRDLLRHRTQNASLSGSLKIQVGTEGFVLNFGASRSAGWEISLPEIGFARAIMGTDCLSDRLGENGHSDMHQMLNVLFPELGPFFWLADSL